MARSTQPKLQRVPVCVRLSERLWKRAKLHAAKQDRPPGYLVDDALRQYFERLQPQSTGEDTER